MKKFVCDASALVNIKEPNSQGYSPGHSLFKDLADGWIQGPYKNIFPAIAAFEIDATVSKLHRKEKPILRDFYVVDELWPDYQKEQFYEALRWYAKQDVTLGG